MAVGDVEARTQKTGVDPVEREKKVQGITSKMYEFCGEQ
jgi:hypothetical protein